MDDIKEQILSRWRHYNRKRYSDDKTLGKILEDVPNASQEMVESVIFSQILTGESLLKILKKHPSMSILDIANEFNVAPKVVEDEVDKLREYGINVDIESYNVELLDKIQPPAPSFIDPKDFFRSTGDTNRIAVIADTHLCSKYERLDALNAFLDVCVDEKIRDVYICGNMIDGETNFNKYDIKTKGFEAQIEYFVNNYPHKKSLTTHVLTGDDHEGWYVQREHINVGKFLELKAKDMGRDDIKYIGHMEKDFIFSQNHRNKQSVRFIHAGGGSSYSISYSSQKYVESLQSGEKPRIVFVGHFHKYDVSYPREVVMVQVGAFQDQTPFMRKKRIHSQIGGTIAEFHTCNGIINRFKHEFIPFYNKDFYYWDKEQKGEL